MRAARTGQAGLWGSILILAFSWMVPALAQIKPPAVSPPGGLRVQAPKVAGKLTLDRLRKLSPAERRRALQNVPPERRQEIEKRLRQYNQLSPAERKRLARQYESFQNLAPEKQEAMRRMYRRFNQMPEERRAVLREELNQLQMMEEEDRRSRINSDEFRNKYDRNEQQLLEDLSRILAEARREEARVR